MEGGVTIADRGDRAIGHLPHAQEPLLGEHWLDDGVASRAYADRMRVRLDLFEQPRRLEVSDDLFASFLAREPLVWTAVLVDMRRAIEHRDLLESVTLTEFEVHWVVAGSHLQCAGPEFTIDRGISNDLYLSSN